MMAVSIIPWRSLRLDARTKILRSLGVCRSGSLHKYYSIPSWPYCLSASTISRPIIRCSFLHISWQIPSTVLFASVTGANGDAIHSYESLVNRGFRVARHLQLCSLPPPVSGKLSPL